MPKSSIVIPENTHLYRTLDHLAIHQRMVFFSGLPGVGKSLLLNQMAQIAHAHGRQIHLMQWDVCRQPFETNAAVQDAYPEMDGITHGAIRKAVGIWARKAIGQWETAYSGADHMLIGELSMVGNRLIELVRPEDDQAEPLLSGDRTRFITPVPTRDVRRVIEDNREKRSADPQHEREQADAMPQVMRALWEELYHVAHTLGAIDQVPSKASMVYDPDVYGGVFNALLKHRHHQVLSIDIHLCTDHLSVYDLNIHKNELIPSEADVADCIAAVEHRYQNQDVLNQEIARWYIV